MRAIKSIRSSYYYVIALAISLVFLVSGIAFIQYEAVLSRAETVGYIEETTNQIKFVVEEHIDEEFETLMAAAVVAQDKDLLLCDDVLRTLINGLGDHNEYVRIGFADAAGQALWIDRYDREHRADLSSEGFIQRALSGENSLSRARHDDLSGIDIHYYAVPIYDGETDKIEGVMFAAAPQDELRTIVGHSLHAGKGLAHIIDDQGNYIVKSDSPLFIGIGDNIFELRTPLNEDVKKEIADNFAARKSGHLVKEFYGENRLIAYVPLEINDWYVFYAVPEDLVKTIMVGTIIVISVATAIFIVFVLLIFSVNRKNREALEKLAFVDPITGHRNFQKFLLDAEEILKNTGDARFAVCYCDIKDFKYINDVFGRDVGDRLLRYFAEFQDHITQDGEIAARINGDTFVSLRKYQTKREIEQRFAGTAQQMAIFPETLSRGYRVEVYGGAYLINPEDGNLSLNHDKYDIIIMDLDLPVMGGRETARKIRGSGYANSATLPIVAISGGNIDERDIFSKALHKPFDLKLLLTVICDLLGTERPTL